MINKKQINNFLKKWNLELHGVNYMQALRRGSFRNSEFDYFKEYFQKSKITIFDIGANVGLKVKEFQSQFPDSTIYAIEPLPSLFNKLSESNSSNPNVRVFNIGISDRSERLEFHVNSGVDTSSFLVSQKTGLNSDNQVKTLQTEYLPVVSLDEFVIDNDISKIDILKMDIQGSELNALKGAYKLLLDKRIEIIYLETYFIQQYVNQPLFFEIAEYLRSFGYSLQDLYNPIYGNSRLAWCDAVFVLNKQD